MHLCQSCSGDVARKLRKYFRGHLVALKQDFGCNYGQKTAKVLGTAHKVNLSKKEENV